MKKYAIPIYISNKNTYLIDKKKEFHVIKHKKTLFKNGYFINENNFEEHIIKILSKYKIKNHFFNLKIIFFINFYNDINKNIIKDILQKQFFNQTMVQKTDFLSSKNLKIFITKNHLIVENQKMLNFDMFYDKKDILKGIMKYIYYSIDYFDKKPIIYGDSNYIQRILKLRPKFLYIEDFNALIKEKLLKSIQNY